jgi:MFS family permease
VPDLQDGARAWWVVLAAFVAMFTSFGVAYSFGAFLLPMSEALGSGPGSTAAVFSLTTMALFGLGALSGPAVDRFGPRRVVLVGAVAMGLGLVLTSRATALWQAYLGHGLGVGLGVACSYVPLVAVVGGWFTRRRTLAVGIAVSGIGLGTLLVAPLAAELIVRYGWRETYLLLAAGSTVALTGCALLLRAAPTTTEAEPAPLLDRLRTPTYVRLYASGLLLSIVLFVPFVHLPAYAVSRGASDVAAATLVGVIGAASIVGRLALGAAAARTGVLRTYQACFALMAGSFLLWLGAPRLPAARRLRGAPGRRVRRVRRARPRAGREPVRAPGAGRAAGHPLHLRGVGVGHRTAGCRRDHRRDGRVPAGGPRGADRRGRSHRAGAHGPDAARRRHPTSRTDHPCVT